MFGGVEGIVRGLFVAKINLALSQHHHAHRQSGTGWWARQAANPTEEARGVRGKSKARSGGGSERAGDRAGDRTGEQTSGRAGQRRDANQLTLHGHADGDRLVGVD